MNMNVFKSICQILLLITQQFNQMGDRANPNHIDPLDIKLIKGRRPSLPSHNSNKNQSPRKETNQPIQHGQFKKILYDRVRDNCITLMSDSMQTLQLPLGLIRQNIKIGFPIKMRLEYDNARQQSDDIRFKGVQKKIYEEFKMQK